MDTNANTATRIDVEAGTRLCVQGRRRQEFGVLVSGRARVERDGAVVAELGVGDHFGEFTVLRGLASPVTIVAHEPTTVDVVTGCEFRGTIGADDEARRAVEQVLDARIRDWVWAGEATAVAESAIAGVRWHDGDPRAWANAHTSVTRLGSGTRRPQWRE